MKHHVLTQLLKLSIAYELRKREKRETAQMQSLKENCVKSQIVEHKPYSKMVLGI